MRTAIQGSPQTLTAIGSRWTRGADENDPGVHPFRKTFEQLEIGDTLNTDAREVTLEDIQHFAEFTGDTFGSLPVKGKNTLQEVTYDVVIHHNRNCFVPPLRCQYDQHCSRH